MTSTLTLSGVDTKDASALARPIQEAIAAITGVDDVRITVYTVVPDAGRRLSTSIVVEFEVVVPSDMPASMVQAKLAPGVATRNKLQQHLRNSAGIDVLVTLAAPVVDVRVVPKRTVVYAWSAAPSPAACPQTCDAASSTLSAECVANDGSTGHAATACSGARPTTICLATAACSEFDSAVIGIVGAGAGAGLLIALAVFRYAFRCVPTRRGESRRRRDEDWPEDCTPMSRHTGRTAFPGAFYAKQPYEGGEGGTFQRLSNHAKRRESGTGLPDGRLGLVIDQEVTDWFDDLSKFETCAAVDNLRKHRAGAPGSPSARNEVTVGGIEWPPTPRRRSTRQPASAASSRRGSAAVIDVARVSVRDRRPSAYP